VVSTPASLLWALPVFACLFAMAAGLTRPVWSDPAGLALGAPEGEASAHLWGLWVAAEGLWAHGPFVRVADAAWPAGFRSDLVDPVHLLLVAPAVWTLGDVGAALAWNALPVASLALAALGGLWLGARLGLGPGGRALLAGLLVCSPAFAGATVPVGRSEQLVLGWSALHLAALHAAIREGGARRVALAGLTLALQGLGGWRPLMLLLFLELPLALAWASGPRGLVRALGVGALGATLTLPMLFAHVGTAPWWLDAGPWPSPFDHEVTPARLGALLSPTGAGAWAGDPTANAGRIALVAAGVGSVLRPRAALPWLGLGLVLWALSLGLQVDPGAGLAPGFGPAAYLAWVVPPLRAVHGWARLAPLALVPLAIAAARGLDGRGRARTGGLVLVLAFALLEGLVWRPVGQGSVALAAPEGVAALPGGALVSLPLTPAPGPAAQGAVDLALLQAWALGRASTVAPSPHATTAGPLLGPLGQVGRPAPPAPCDPTLGPRLATAGAGGVVLQLDALPPGPASKEAVARVRAQLGDATARGDGWMAWALPPGEPCAR
jgi:hypothetical protein